MPDFDIQNVLAQLTRSIGENPIDIKPIAESGSARKYYRIVTEKGSLIGAYNANTEENEAFFYLTEHFGKIGLNVPKLLIVNEERNCYLQSDHGDETLFQHIQRTLTSGVYDDPTAHTRSWP